MICKDCEKLAYTMELKVCKICKKTSDHDPKTRRYCTSCAKKLGICRTCGKELKK